MKTLTYNYESQEWVESDDGLEPETLSTEWHLKVLRKKRNCLLAESDWTQLTDNALTDAKKQEWAVYRQQLRDLPANTSDFENVNYPTPPN